MIKLLIKLFKFIFYTTLTLLFAPYGVGISLYLVLKYTARSGTALEESVIEFEKSLLEMANQLITIYNPVFVSFIILGIIFLICLFLILRKYKIVIPKVKKVYTEEKSE